MQKTPLNTDKIALFAFRKTQKLFFEKLLESCTDSKMKIIFSKQSYLISLSAFKYLPQVDLTKACDFAIAEFYAKVGIKVPKFILEIFFKVSAVMNFLRYYKALDERYSKMLIWNGGKFRQLIALDVAKILNIKVYYFENGLLPNTLVFDEKGINYNNSVPRDKAFFETYHSNIDLPTALVPRVGKDREIFKGKKDTLPDVYIFVPFQVDYDTQILTQSQWIKDMRMLFDLIEDMAKQSGYHFVFKEHPSSGVVYNDLHQKVVDGEHLHFRNTYSTQELIEKSLAVLTINSTVGIESLLFYKKVIVLGNAFYGIEGISYTVKNSDELLGVLYKIKSVTIDKSLIENFLKYLYHDYLVPKNEETHILFCKKLLEEQSLKEKSD